MEGSWAHKRKAAWKRSGGKCELCGFDIASMMKDLRAYQDAARDKLGWLEAAKATKAYAKLMYGIRARKWPDPCWAADHIKPIAEGGDPLPPLEKIRILDFECHDKVTRELFKRLAERRKNHRWMPLFPKT